MLEFVTKHQYWQLLDAQIDKKLATTKAPWRPFRSKEMPWHLKSVQDVMAYHYLHEPIAQNIGEIGGGNSRLLPVLASQNRCHNIEKFEGQDGGPSKETKIKNVRNVHAFVGEFDSALEESSLDVVFSVSVVEHIPNDKLADFIRDCHRILKPGGRMVHLVDMYLNPTRTKLNESRATCYRSAFDGGLFKPEAEVSIRSEEDLQFNEAFCTNPDNIMYMWNRVAPNLHELRQNSQCVALSWIGQAIKN